MKSFPSCKDLAEITESNFPGPKPGYTQQTMDKPIPRNISYSILPWQTVQLYTTVI